MLKISEQGICMFRGGLQEESYESFMYNELANSGKWLWEDLSGSDNYIDEDLCRAVAVGMERRETTKNEVIVLVN